MSHKKTSYLDHYASMKYDIMIKLPTKELKELKQFFKYIGQISVEFIYKNETFSYYYTFDNNKIEQIELILLASGRTESQIREVADMISRYYKVDPPKDIKLDETVFTAYIDPPNPAFNIDAAIRDIEDFIIPSYEKVRNPFITMNDITLKQFSVVYVPEDRIRYIATTKVILSSSEDN